MSVAENIYFGRISCSESRGFFVRRSEAVALAAEWTKKLGIRALNPASRVV
jgi:simple sugar transport system ATP-binding protein